MNLGVHTVVMRLLRISPLTIGLAILLIVSFEEVVCVLTYSSATSLTCSTLSIIICGVLIRALVVLKGWIGVNTLFIISVPLIVRVIAIHRSVWVLTIIWGGAALSYSLYNVLHLVNLVLVGRKVLSMVTIVIFWVKTISSMSQGLNATSRMMITLNTIQVSYSTLI